MGGGLPLRLWYLQGWVRSSSAQSSRPEWPAFSSVRAARTSATERRDRGNPGPSPHPAGGRQIECRNNVGCRILVVSKGAGFDFSLATLSGGRPGPTTPCPTLCADKNAPFRPRRPQYIFHPPETALLSCRSSPLQPNGISCPDSVPVPANLYHRI